jgi:thiopeptide-type bacteriocin biosynthesis protein
MSNDHLRYTCLGPALVRVPTLPADRAEQAVADVDLDDVAALRAHLSRLVADPLVREAVAVSSRPLATLLDDVLADRPITPARLRRAVGAVTRYLLRMATRSTPFGLMGGVAAAAFGGSASIDMGAEQRKVARCDMEWLLHLVVEWEQRPQVWRELDIVASDLITRRGDRVVVTRQPFTGDVDAMAETSIRLAPVVREILSSARQRVRGGQLHTTLEHHFPEAPPGALDQAIGRLIEHEFLLTSLRPPMDAADPLAHVLEQLREVSDFPERDRLVSIERQLRAYSATSPGSGLPIWGALTADMRRLRPMDRVVQVDMAVGARFRLPAAVAGEAERAANVLSRMAAGPDPLPHLRDYHHEFLERYGTSRLVLVKDLLDPNVGLGVPSGYRVPRTAGPAPRWQSRHDDGGRDELLATLVLDAVRQGSREIVLDDATVAALSTDDRFEPTSSLELYGRLVTDSAQALDAGQFQLWLSTTSGSDQAGATSGRFLHLLGDDFVDDRVATNDEPGGALDVQLSYRPASARAANLAQVPRRRKYRIRVGEFTDPADPGSIGIDDLLVGANGRRLFLYSASLRREIRPVSPFMLLLGQAPNLARFLREIHWSGAGRWIGWNWGGMAVAPFTPRVRYGRTVLAGARWLPNAPFFADRTLSHAQWRRRLDDWRDRWAVPDTACLSTEDRYLELNLTAPLHVRLLREDLAARPGSVLREVPDDGGPGASWIVGPDGGRHRGEVVFSLVSNGSRSAAKPPQPAPRAAEHLPGGDWLYAKVYAAEHSHETVLAEWLPRLVEELSTGIDRWFFIRYRDPEPHLRIRLHGDPHALRTHVLPAVADWVAELRAARLARTLTVDTYDPESERYGGTEALQAAETVFRADSEAVLAQLRACRQGRLPLDRNVLAALNYLDIVQAFQAPGDTERPISEIPKNEPSHQRSRRQRDELATLLAARPSDGLPATLPDDPGLRAAWRARAEELRRYGDHLRRLDGDGSAQTSPGEVLSSLLHMHFNRINGMDRRTESLVLAIARGAAVAHRARQKALG